MKRFWQVYKSLLAFYRPHQRQGCWGISLSVLTLLAGVALVALSGWFLTATALTGLGVWSALQYNLFAPSAPIRFFAVAKTLSRYGERLVTHRVTFRVLVDLQTWVFGRMIRLNRSARRQYRSGELLQRLVDDLEQVSHLYLRVLLPGLTGVLAGLLVLGGMALLQPLLAAVLLLPWATTGLLLPLLSARLGNKASGQQSDVRSQLQSALVEHVRGLAALRAYGGLDEHRQRLRNLFGQLARLERLQTLQSGLTEGLRVILLNGSVLLVSYTGFGLLERAALNGAQLVMIVLATVALLEALSPLTRSFQQAGGAVRAAQRLLALKDTSPAVTASPPAVIRPCQFDWHFEGVTFGYGQEFHPVLEALQWHLPTGSKTVLTGPNGAGKTTLLQLMAGLQEPQSGSLRLGGHPLVNLPDGQLWEWVGLMEQQVALFDASILENIRLAKEGATLREVEEALDKAHLTAFVASLPAGLATQVGESGLQLSHGQARRVALARLFLKNPPVVLLDEPTAGLDAHAEALVLDAVDELARDKTLLIVTHRPAVLERFARSYQMVEGKVYPL